MTTIDINTFKQYKQKGLLKVQECPWNNLLIWNYTDKVCIKKTWDPITIMARALVTDNKGNVIARSFNKFHNIEENLHKPSQEFSVYEKMDGSLGLLFYYENEWIISSRGSFRSEQSIEAKKMLEGKDLDKLNKEFAYSFEIIYPENKIVVDYGSQRDLVFLAAFKVDGKEVTEESINSLIEAGFTIVKEYKFDDYTTIKNLNKHNAEGFIVRFHRTGDRVKIKFENYIHLHKFAINLNEKSVWNMYCSGKTLEECMKGLPDEFYDWFKEEWDKLDKKFNEIKQQCLETFEKYKEIKEKKDFVKATFNHNHFNLIINIYSGKFQDKDIFPYIKPKTDKSYKANNTLKKTTVNVTKEFLVMVGVSGSGKSTYARSILKENPKAVRVNRDTIRMCLFGYTEETLQEHYQKKNINQLEELVTKTEYNMIETLLQDNNTELIIIDDTNLQKSIINKFCNTFSGYKFTFKLIESLRDSASSLNKELIKKQNIKLKTLKKNFKFETIVPIPSPVLVQNKELPKAIVCDLDGTLCLMHNRNPHEYNKVKEDLLCEQVKNTLEALKAFGYKIIIATGRPKEAEKDSKEWLDNYCIEYDSFYCRAKNDFRKDFVVKQEMWEDMIKKYYIEFMLDDRDQVVKHSRDCGFKVFQVEYGNF